MEIFSKAAVAFCTSASNVWEFLLLHVLFGIVSVLNFSHSNSVQLYLIVILIWIFNGIQCRTSFYIAYLPSVYLFWWNICLNLLLTFELGVFFLLLLSYKSSLHILDTSSLSDINLVNIFSSPVGLSFYFFDYLLRSWRF